MADLKMRLREFKAKLEQLTETIEKNHSEVLAKISQMTDATLQLNRIMDVKLKQGNSTKQEPSCTIVFCGRSFYSGGPGPSGGAGVILLVEDGSVFCAFREGLGNQTSYVAEYRALILGLKKASMKGFKHIAVKGDSDFVINQFGKPWETTDLQLRNLCLEAMKLSRSFHSFSMEIIPMGDDNQAVVEAIRAINIGEGQVEEENLLNQ
ncbi:Polynucleotidyl transferase, ribonuclease H superfamily protein [Trifolium repens]|nr:Polynucleotidyl transferase, ribonuclease H superfamily protein [Trifolium repens]